MDSNNPDLMKIKRIKIYEEAENVFPEEMFELIHDKLQSAIYKEILKIFGQTP